MGKPSILFTGGEVAGCLCLEGVTRFENELIVVPDHPTRDIEKVAKKHNLKIFDSVEKSPTTDTLLSVHSRTILSPEQLSRFRLGCWNIHPFLMDFPGKDPVGKFLRLYDGKPGPYPIHVCLHRMTSTVDGGAIKYTATGITHGKTHEEVYDSLYTLYIELIEKFMEGLK